MRNLLTTQGLARDEAIAILDVAEDMASVSEREVKKLPTLRGKTVINLTGHREPRRPWPTAAGSMPE